MADPRTKLTEPRVEALLAALRHGCTRRAAAGAAGISHQTFYNWLADLTLLDEVEKAEAAAEAVFTGLVAEAAVTSWQAAAWWLERRKWQDYGRHDRVDVDLRKEAERLAAGLDGVSADDLVAEAERIATAR